ncbi:PEP-CTERM sorting domain-containing protein [Pseudoduganella buxea]|uniref:Ice-binding protein C-terminal domain-containing protein n=1 Tax=Pseudoduganella buxea TaxID=1949069 RepID=A0ABQ1KGS7_9BURK|nr:PEP-CTERM sorting domain-containing protein [Pseudoduganella buxea]GGB95373.1 hypothetical protein GCM10011572_16710 [Pseudoduganella buxea]
MKPWLISAALLLASNCAATPVVLTSSSSGLVNFTGLQNTANVLADVGWGEDYQLTTSFAYDTDSVTGQGPTKQTVTGEVTLNLAHGFFPETIRLVNLGTATTTYTPIDENGNGGRMQLVIAFADPDDPRWSYQLVRSFDWLPGDRPGESLLEQVRYANLIAAGGESIGVEENGTHLSYMSMGGGATQLTISPVPEPATYGMLLAGLAGVGLYARRRKAA